MIEACPHCGKTFDITPPLKHGLTPSQWAVAEQVYLGKGYKQVAEALGLSIKTVQFHSRRIYRAWKVHTKYEVLRKMIEIRQAEERGVRYE